MGVRCNRVLCLWLVVCLLPMLAWGQAPPLVVQTNDKATKCQPAFLIGVNDGSLSCPTVDGLPAAVINIGTPTATTPFNQVTGGANPNTLTVTTGGTLRPALTGVIGANELLTGTINQPALTHTSMVAGSMYAGNTTAGSVKVVSIAECDAATEKIRWNATSLAWECVADQGMTNAAWPSITPGTNTNAGTFSFQGTALFDVQSQARIPSSTAGALVDREVIIDSDGDGALHSKPYLSWREGGTAFACFSPSTGPTGDGQIEVFRTASGGKVWENMPSGTDENVKVSTADTTAGKLEDKLIAGTSITIVKNNPGANETLTINSTGGGAGNPGGADTQVQYNDGGVFNGDATYTFNKTTKVVTAQSVETTGVSGTPGFYTVREDLAFGTNRIKVNAPAGDLVDVECTLENDSTPYDGCIEPGGGTDENVKVSAVDTTAGFLSAKLVAGTGVTLTPSGAGNETLTVAASGAGGAYTTTETYDMVGCPPGSTGETNWDADTGTVTPSCGTDTFRDGLLAFAEAGTSCVQRKTTFGPAWNAAVAPTAYLLWQTGVITGNVTWTLALGCKDTGETSAGGTFNTPTSMTSDANAVANARQPVVFSNLAVVGCSVLDTVYMRLCKTADTLAATNTGNAFQFIFTYSNQ